MTNEEFLRNYCNLVQIIICQAEVCTLDMLEWGEHKDCADYGNSCIRCVEEWMKKEKTGEIKACFFKNRFDAAE